MSTLLSQPAWARQEPAEYKTLLATCYACHGSNGISTNDEWPNLKGQKKTYLIHQLQAFKSDERVNAIMSPIAKTLSDQEMEGLASYFSELGKK